MRPSATSDARARSRRSAARALQRKKPITTAAHGLHEFGPLRSRASLSPLARATKRGAGAPLPAPARAGRLPSAMADKTAADEFSLEEDDVFEDFESDGARCGASGVGGRPRLAPSGRPGSLWQVL